MRNEYLVFGKPRIEEPEIEEVVRSMRSGWLGTGPKVQQFESAVAAYKGVKHALALNSCTAGLHLACTALGLEAGDEVIVPAMTFCATVNAVVHAGATPVVVDVDPQTFNMDPAAVQKAITPRTRAIMPVHFAGRCCDMAALQAIARGHGLRIIEDCAHAIESMDGDRPAGAIGDCGVLSFYSTKNIVTGEGGMVLTNDSTIASRIKVLGLHGMSADAWKRFSDDGYKHYDVVEIGFKYNMMDLQAAIGIHQLKQVEPYWNRRLEIWNRYNEAFADLPVQLPAALPATGRHALHLYTLLIDATRSAVSRDEFVMAMHRRGIGTGVHYRAIPALTVYQKRFGWSVDQVPVAREIGNRTVSLPLSAKLTDADVADVIESVRGIVLGGK